MLGATEKTRISVVMANGKEEICQGCALLKYFLIFGSSVEVWMRRGIFTSMQCMEPTALLNLV